jgi:hypothetical protein
MELEVICTIRARSTKANGRKISTTAKEAIGSKMVDITRVILCEASEKGKGSNISTRITGTKASSKTIKDMERECSCKVAIGSKASSLRAKSIARKE